MDPQIAARFNDAILQAALQRYDIAADKIQLLDGFESFIYEFNRPDGDFILRIGHAARRTPDLIHGEVDWINYLSDARRDRRPRHPLADREPGRADRRRARRRSSCARPSSRPAAGSPGKSRSTSACSSTTAACSGACTPLAKTYTPSNPAWKRYTWDGPENNTPDRQLPRERNGASARNTDRFSHHLQALPCDPESYGMIHQDAHTGNLFVDENYILTLFDFDDCVYGHFIYDIAMVLFYIARLGRGRYPRLHRPLSCPVFLQGYREHNHLDPRLVDGDPPLPETARDRPVRRHPVHHGRGLRKMTPGAPATCKAAARRSRRMCPSSNLTGTRWRSTFKNLYLLKIGNENADFLNPHTGLLFLETQNVGEGLRPSPTTPYRY